ncbi:MAG TPA: response regulator [Burkholderiaceae bacterium]|nr:response regulator [Burkholderiaceae bacterium]
MTTQTLYIVDDNPEFLESTRFWLSGDGLQVHTWSDPRQAIEALAARDRSQPACLLLDIRMPQLSGLQLHDALRERGAELPIIYMSGHADVPLAVQAMQKGAVTLLEKPFDEAMLDAALRQAFERAGHPASVGARIGAPPADGAAATAPVAAMPPLPTPDDDARARFAARQARLSPRERQVLDLVIQGIYNKNIADRIGLSIKTVELYRARGMSKMQARSVAELTRMMVTAQVH